MKKFLLILLALVLALPATVFAQGYMDDTTNFQKSMEILEELGCNVEKEHQLFNLRSAKDTNRVNLGNESFALLDEDNRIISIDRIKETNGDYFRQNTPKKDFRVTQNLVEQKLVKEGYELVHSGYFDDTTLRLRYEKMMPYGGHNQYDAYDAYIDTENGALVSFKKKGIEKNEISLRSFSQTKNPISEDEAIGIANEFLKKYNKGEIQEVRIGTAIPNNDFFRLMDGKEETEPVIISEENLEGHIIKEVYILKNEEVEVYVDLYSGEIIGGELYLYNAGAMSVSDSAIPYPRESVTDAQSGLYRMGYNSVDMAIGLSNGFKTRAINMLPKRAFYVNAHGSANVIGSNDGSSFMRSSEVPDGTYQFVFLDACNTGSESTWASAFGIRNRTSNKRAFLGWYESIGGYFSYNYLWQFWNSTASGKSVRQAALDAANKIPEYCPIRFYGNRNYDGFY